MKRITIVCLIAIAGYFLNGCAAAISAVFFPYTSNDKEKAIEEYKETAEYKEKLNESERINEKQLAKIAVESKYVSDRIKQFHVVRKALPRICRKYEQQRINGKLVIGPCKEYSPITYIDTKEEYFVNIYSDNRIEYNIKYQDEIVESGATPSLRTLHIEEEPYVVEWKNKDGSVKTKEVKFSAIKAKVITNVKESNFAGLTYTAGIFAGLVTFGIANVVDLIYFRGFNWSCYSNITPYSKVITTGGKDSVSVHIE